MPEKSTGNRNRLTPPESLKALQQWFAAEILHSRSHGRGLSSAEAEKYLTPSGTLTPRERLDIYVHDYWPRCLDSLADDFPGLKRVMGGEAFRRQMEAYLRAYPSRSFTLYHLGQDMHRFLSDEYHGPDRDMLLEITAYEWAKMRAGFSAHYPPFDPAKLSGAQAAQLSQTGFEFQPHWQLLSLSHRLPEWSSAGFKTERPEAGETHVAVYQENGRTSVLVLERPRFLLFEALYKGATLEKAVESLTAVVSPAEYEGVLANIQSWFETCILLEWCVHPGKGGIFEDVS